ncbi:MAG TPA: rhomboid family intramembrane serine protease [Acidimicrobiia bacterium]|jgi:membrane associated rhomboid family serine protease|nr:rhomboid family intramembrane serine protease [Acidimicrobiia bacterium]
MDERLSTTVCYRHPDRATRLRCSECDRPICTECSHDSAVGQRCPECASPQGRYRVVDARRTVVGPPSFATAPVSFTIIGIAAALFVAGFASPSIEAELLNRFASANWLIEEGDWWRVFTAAFLHGGIVHIFFNMYVLYIFGPRMEIQVGSVPFALLYAASAAGGGAASYLLGPLNQVAVGASGAIFGLFGAWIYVAFRMRGTAGGRAMFNQLGVLLLINLALPLIIPNIDWRAHVGGLVTGVLIAALWSQFARGHDNVVLRRSVIAATVLVGLVALIILG